MVDICRSVLYLRTMLSTQRSWEWCIDILFCFLLSHLICYQLEYIAMKHKSFQIANERLMTWKLSIPYDYLRKWVTAVLIRSSGNFSVFRVFDFHVTIEISPAIEKLY